ncbi:hypothetical protein [Leptolyngbya sp. O-77]|uniref:hypothetical protein n=1 Tax=Leptolyngbya sp. O-77 TaxID=1080068 RepID=UPI00074D3666|nr:hypothetical protein [Leptolyngbya sp. O-77]BAU43604.1 hypothetical protein O77CONTIG1_03436 [Leptolyngbya sp. O-77]
MTTLELITSLAFACMIVGLFFDLDSTVKRIDRRTKRLELCLDLILDRLEIDTPFQLSERIKQIALDPERKVEAIRLYKEETNVTLREAVDAINAYIAQHQSSSNP